MRIRAVRDFGLVVRDRRHALGWSQADLARAAGVSRWWVSEFESGKGTAEIALALRTCGALGLVVDMSAVEDEAHPATLGAAVDLDDLLRRLGEDT